ncbi:hypothetical protein J1N35_026620 [Gossypium stocksii]|uniref:Uncharacterized protein n=1 Tax=Gossypium stocksii TaxID=47602 RepID=A0A9D3V8F9_9ROSI|nr:hypothetical protein J1N35_026620 [Gossypium stocksii]
MDLNDWHVKVLLDLWQAYLLTEEDRRQHPYTSRPRWAPLNSMGGWTVGHPSLIWYTPGPSHFSMVTTHTTMYRPSKYEALMGSPLVIPLTYGTQHSYAYSPWVTQTPPASLFCQGGPSSQPPRYRLEVVQMQRSTLTKGEPQQPQPRSKAELRRNPARNCQPP